VGSLRPSLSRHAIFRLFVASLGLSAVAAAAVAAFVRPPGALPATHKVLFAIAGAALGLSVACVLVARLRRRPSRLDSVIPPGTQSSILLALAAWFPLLLVSAISRHAARSRPRSSGTPRSGSWTSGGDPVSTP